MQWPFKGKTALPLVEGDNLNLKVLSPTLAAIIRTYLGKLDKSNLSALECQQIEQMFNTLPPSQYRLVSKGLFDEYGAPIEKIKALPPDPRRK